MFYRENYNKRIFGSLVCYSMCIIGRPALKFLQENLPISLYLLGDFQKEVHMKQKEY